MWHFPLILEYYRRIYWIWWQPKVSWVVKYLMNNFVYVLSRDYSVYYILRHMLHCIFRNSRPDVFLVKGVTKNMQKIDRGTLLPKCDFNLQSNFNEITLRHGCFPVNLLHIFKIPFSKNTSGWLLLYFNTLSASVALI